MFKIKTLIFHPAKEVLNVLRIILEIILPHCFLEDQTEFFSKFVVIFVALDHSMWIFAKLWAKIVAGDGRKQ